MADVGGNVTGMEGAGFMDSGLKGRSLLLTEPRTLEWTEKTLPSPGTDEVLVRTDRGAMSVGSELPAYMGNERRSSPPGHPRMTGYESVGTVVECGSSVGEGLRVGDRIVGFYGHRTHAVVSEGKVIRVPDGVTDELALLSILSCDVAKGIRKLNVKPEEPSLVVGAGAIGLLTILVMGAYGAANVDVVEPDGHRLSKATVFGARSAMKPEEATKCRKTYSVGVECSGRGAAFGILQKRMRPGGRICVLSDGDVETLSLEPDFHEKELSVVGSSDGWDYAGHARWYFDLLRRDESLRRNLESLFELRVSAKELPHVFEKTAAGDVSPIKVLVEYGR